MRRHSLAVAVALFAVGSAVALALSPGRDQDVVRTTRPGRDQDAVRTPRRPARRVVTIGPNVTETVFALGAGDEVAAVTDFCTYPPEACEKPRVGGLFHPNLERIIALEPDLVIMQSPVEKVIGLCRRRGIRHLILGMHTLDSIRSGILAAGRALGREGEAERLVGRMRADLDRVRERVRGGDGGGGCRAKLFLCTGRAPGELSRLGTIGPGGFLAELVEIAGGENVFADARVPYPQISKEALVARAPEVVIEARPGESAPARPRSEWNALASLPAVRAGRVHVLTEEFLLIPGPRVAETARLLAELLHPGVSPHRSKERPAGARPDGDGARRGRGPE